MKKIFLYFIFTMPQILTAQSLYLTNGAQCDIHASGGCEHYQSLCPQEATAEIRFELQTDGQAAETSWQIIDETDNGSIVGEGSGLDNHTTYIHRFCAFIDRCYRFVIEDAGGNGIASEEGYSLYWNGDLRQSDSDFGALQTIEWGGCCTDFSVFLKGGIACIYNAYGQVFAETKGGTPPFQYDWSSAASYTEVHPIAASDENIALTVTDAAGCMTNVNLDLSDLTFLTLEVETSPVTNTQPDIGKATAIIINGVPPFIYQWANGRYTKTIHSLLAGDYEVTVTDGSGCTAVATGEVFTPLREVDQAVFNLQCFPNPTDQQIYVTFNTTVSNQGHLQIINAEGVLVFRREIAILSGENRHELNVVHLPAGQYWLGVQIGTFREFIAVQLVD